LIDDLLRHTHCSIVVAGRHAVRSDRFKSVVADLHDRASLERALAGVEVVICAAGPYQKLPTLLAEMCIERRIHYIDFADHRLFVQRIREMGEHRRPGAAICTGWSTVPALSGLLTQIASAGMKSVDSIRIHMAPGNRGARQTATIASLLHSVGRPFQIFQNGEWHTVIGWSEPRDFLFPSPIHKRRGYLIDVPDHEVFPRLFGARTVEFRAGSELLLLNGCLSLLRMTRRDWTAWAKVFQRTAALCSWMGHDFGAVGVEVEGTARRRACIVAESQGERIATMPAAVMTDFLASGTTVQGLVSYADWLSEDRLRLECERRGFRLIVERF